MRLRDYQRDGANKIWQALQTKRSVCAVSATGSGKTVTFSAIARKWPGRVLVLVHREELLKQTPDDLDVRMIMTYRARGMEENPDLIIIDECHRGEFNPVFEAHPNAKILGFTATPVRLSKKNPLSDQYERLVVIKDTPELIAEGFLVKPRTFALQLGADDVARLKKANTGDFTGKSLDLVFGSDRLIKLTVEQWREKCQDRKTMVFAGTTKQAAQLRAAFQAEGVQVFAYDSVNNEANERVEIVEGFKAAAPGSVLINVGVFTEGFDCPSVDAIIFARSTASLSLFIQVAGRGARLFPGKKDFLLIDLGNNILKQSGEVNHGLWEDSRDWQRLFQGKRGSKSLGAPLYRFCDNCGQMEPVQVKVCGECGTPFPPPKPKQEASESAKVIELGKQKRGLRREQGLAKTYADLLKIEKERGYKNGWALHIWNSRKR